MRRFPDTPLMDPIKDMEIQNDKLVDSLEKMNNLNLTLKQMNNFNNVKLKLLRMILKNLNIRKKSELI